MLVKDRRDHVGRAVVLSRVVEWLRAQSAPACHIPAQVADKSVAERIVTRLAVRGLVRKGSAGWLASPVLLSPPELEHVDA